MLPRDLKKCLDAELFSKLSGISPKRLKTGGVFSDKEISRLQFIFYAVQCLAGAYANSSAINRPVKF